MIGSLSNWLLILLSIIIFIFEILVLTSIIYLWLRISNNKIPSNNKALAIVNLILSILIFISGIVAFIFLFI